jgi:hypothetical protein
MCEEREAISYREHGTTSDTGKPRCFHSDVVLPQVDHGRGLRAHEIMRDALGTKRVTAARSVTSVPYTQGQGMRSIELHMRG